MYKIYNYAGNLIKQIIKNIMCVIKRNTYSKHYYQIKGEKAESILHALAFDTFLTDWCYLNQKLPNSNEICDLLVVFDKIAIIWQVKSLKLDKKGKYNRAEIDKNIRQLSGAKRQLFKVGAPIELENPRRGKELFNPKDISEVYLISVLFGKGEDYYSGIEEFKNHSIHVFPGKYAEILLNELDTITDFIEYIRKKEALFKVIKKLVILGGEEELLAKYIYANRSFSDLEKADFIYIEGDSWARLIKKPEYIAKKNEDKISYLWDSIINTVHRGGVKEYEQIARELARPNRFFRRILSKAYFEALKIAQRVKQDVFRRVFEVDGVTYCFLFQDATNPRTIRQDHLASMCWIARDLYPNPKIIGIATENTIQTEGTFDLCFLLLPVITAENRKQIDKIKKETGIFTNLVQKPYHEEEYPK